MSHRAASCPSWDRTRTLLIQSQACCQLHQGAVFPFSHGFPQPSDYSSTNTPDQPRDAPAATRQTRGNPIIHQHLRASHRFASRPLARMAAAALIAASTTACSDTFRTGSAGPAALATRSDLLFESFANRFAPNEFSPKVN